MIVELGIVSHYIQVTALYSNAVLAATLPYFSDVSKKLDLIVPQPITQSDVRQFHVLPFRETTASVMLKDGTVFDLHFGFVNRYVSPDAPIYPVQKPDRKREHPIDQQLTEIQAIQVGRESLKKLGVPLEDVFAEQVPHVTVVNKGTNSIPRYRLQWLDPRGNGQVGDDEKSGADKVKAASLPAVDMEINSDTRKVEYLRFALLKSLRKPAPKIAVVPARGEGNYSEPDKSINPVYASKLIPLMFKKIDDYGQTLSLPIHRPLTSNEVAKVTINDNGGWPHCEIELTNGWRFIFRHWMVNGYYAPDNFFNSGDRIIRIKDFVSKPKMTEVDAIALIKRTMAKLNYPTNLVHMDVAPDVVHPAGEFKNGIPRYLFAWEFTKNNDLESKVEAEVDADKKELKSFYYDDKAYWNQRPPIDVPILISHL